MNELARFLCQAPSQAFHGKPVKKRGSDGFLDSKNPSQAMLGKIFLLPAVEALVEFFLKMQRVHFIDGYPMQYGDASQHRFVERAPHLP